MSYEIAGEAARYTVHVGCFAEFPEEQAERKSPTRSIAWRDIGPIGAEILGGAKRAIRGRQ